MDYKKADRMENRTSELQLIEDHFAGVKQSILFLEQLYRDGHGDEALLLCCCYIEALGNNLYWPSQRYTQNFVRVLKEYGGADALWHIHPKQLANELARREDKQGQAIKSKLTALLVKAGAKLYAEDEILCHLQPVLTDHELGWLRRHLWRGSLAAIAYDRIRSRLVHTTGGSNEVTFDNTTFRGGPVPPLNFTLLYGSLSSILQAMKELSFNSGKLYGHDFSSPPEFAEGGNGRVDVAH